jgi:hypothetical protein
MYMRDVKNIEAEIEAAEELLKKKRAVLAEFKQLFGESGEINTHQKLPLHPAHKRKKGEKKSVRKRIREAILRMPDKFTSKKLWSEANEDGGPPINRESAFQPYLTKLQEDGYVTKIREHIGTDPALFEKGPKISAIVAG